MRREATQNIMTDKCFYIRSKKNYIAEAKGKALGRVHQNQTTWRNEVK